MQHTAHCTANRAPAAAAWCAFTVFRILQASSTNVSSMHRHAARTPRCLLNRLRVIAVVFVQPEFNLRPALVRYWRVTNTKLRHHAVQLLCPVFHRVFDCDKRPQYLRVGRTNTGWQCPMINHFAPRGSADSAKSVALGRSRGPSISLTKVNRFQATGNTTLGECPRLSAWVLIKR
uniref:Putative secreted protein n=1 Tax=Anopheles triannulatus TaxID=58253 RepID=A0A2M4B3N0_9DIPT